MKNTLAGTIAASLIVAGLAAGASTQPASAQTAVAKAPSIPTTVAAQQLRRATRAIPTSVDADIDDASKSQLASNAFWTVYWAEVLPEPNGD